jgi:hypothetical protein
MVRKTNFRMNPWEERVLHLCRSALNAGVTLTNLLQNMEIDDENADDAEIVENLKSLHDYLETQMVSCIRYGMYDNPYLDNNDIGNARVNMKLQKKELKRMTIR